MRPIFIFLLACSSTAMACDLTQYVGYTIVAEKTISGYIDQDGTRGSSFKGCQFGRKIIFTDQTYLTCAEYSYTYSYMPQAALLVKDGTWVMVVDDEAFDMTN